MHQNLWVGMIIESKLDIQALREAALLAKEEVAKWPAWQLEVVRLVSWHAASLESREVLYGKDK